MEGKIQSFINITMARHFLAPCSLTRSYIFADERNKLFYNSQSPYVYVYGVCYMLYELETLLILFCVSFFYEKLIPSNLIFAHC